MTKKALVTGVTGQLGSYMAEYLLERHYDVLGLVRRSSTNTHERLENSFKNINFSLVEGDLTDSASVSGIIRKYKPDYIYNFAAQSHVHTSFDQPQYTFQADTCGVLNILESMRQDCPNAKLIHLSTSEMFGKNYSTDKLFGNYQDEDTIFMPQSPYAIAKLAAHHLIRLYRQSYRLFASSVINFNTESPRRGENFVTRKITKYIAKLAKYLHNDTFSSTKLEYPLLSLGNINAYRDWSSASDNIEGIYLVSQYQEATDFVLASEETHSVKEFLDEAFKLINVYDWNPYVLIDEKFKRPSEVEYLRGKATKAHILLNWSPKNTFKDLVREMVMHDLNIEFPSVEFEL